VNFLEGLFPSAKEGHEKRYDEYQRDLVPYLVQGPLYKDKIMKEFEGKRIRLADLEKFYRKEGIL
jgi:hypothetical protein